MPTWLDLERRCSCKADHAGANPVVGSCDLLTNQHDSRVCWTAWQSSKLSDQVRFLGGLLGFAMKPTFRNVLGVCRTARDRAKVEDQVRFLARALWRGEA